jgi:hypothetical protein
MQGQPRTSEVSDSQEYTRLEDQLQIAESLFVSFKE